MLIFQSESFSRKLRKLMDEMVIRRVLEEAITVDSEQSPSHYLTISDGGEILSISAFDTNEEAQSQRELLIDSLIRVISKI